VMCSRAFSRAFTGSSKPAVPAIASASTVVRRLQSRQPLWQLPSPAPAQSTPWLLLRRRERTLGSRRGPSAARTPTAAVRSAARPCLAAIATTYSLA
jgi:hypothetical protein